MPPPPKKKYIYKTDSLVLEDQGQRICLTGDILVDELVTGVTIALLGYINDNGKFRVEEYCFAGECPTVGVAVSNGMEEVSNEDDRYDDMSCVKLVAVDTVNLISYIWQSSSRLTRPTRIMAMYNFG